MVKKTKLQTAVERMVVLKEITSPTGSLSDRAKRDLEKVCKEVRERIKNRQSLSKNSGLTANLTWDDKNYSWARNLSLALDELKEKYPRAWKKADDLIKKHRSVRRAQVEFGVLEDYLSRDLYLEVIEEIGPNPFKGM